ncbi:hypothetical protein PT974_05184 [Cladobotryum mycophilum]|uniref:Uncharacterized protein n=1 Tax=Cladobotryum mycophilum TaxID=491253 RepID=A0ABR0SR52_9HYPO
MSTEVVEIIKAVVSEVGWLLAPKNMDSNSPDASAQDLAHFEQLVISRNGDPELFDTLLHELGEEFIMLYKWPILGVVYNLYDQTLSFLDLKEMDDSIKIWMIWIWREV